MGYILLAISLYLLYRFITGFVIPVARTTSQVKRQFSAMREQMEKEQAQSGQSKPHNARHNTVPESQKPKYDIEGEYIQFEDVR
jgi:hypothetical protein